MFLKWSFLFLACVSYRVSDSAFVDTISKCSIKNQKCLKDLAYALLKDVKKNGIQELNIPSIDPLRIENITVSIPDIFNITMEDGSLHGIGDCMIDDFYMDIEKRVTKVGFICDLIIKGKIKVLGKNPFIKNLLGGESIHADGNVEVKLDKVNITTEFFYSFSQKNDGNIYVTRQPNKFNYDYDVGNFHLTAKNIFLGDLDAGEVIGGFLNQNWKVLLKTFGRNFFDVAMTLFSDILFRLIEGIPTKYYFTEDMNPYLKN